MKVIYEDNHLIIVNKNNSELVQGDITKDLSLEDKIKTYLKEKYNKSGNVFLGVAHRIDRPVSGIVIFAKTGKALERLNRLFKNNEISKKYWAIVKNKPPQLEDTLNHYIVRNTRKNKSYARNIPVKNSKEGSLTYQIIGEAKNYYFLEIELHTGRHHQIRTQLSKVGCPIKGDLKYGFPRSNKNGGISLHAREIRFIHPVQKKQMVFIAEPPEDVLWNQFKNISDK